MKEKYKLMEGDGRVLSMLQEESIDCIITDHPWLDKLSNKGGNRSFANYECFLYEQKDFEEKARVLKPGCFLAEFCLPKMRIIMSRFFRLSNLPKQAA